MPTPSRYWREIPQRYRFEAVKCTKCGKKLFPPRQICPECKGREFEKTKIAETGKILTYTVIHTPPQPFVDQAPYAVGIAELDDGVNLTSQIVDCDFDKIKTGMRVKLEFRKISCDGHSGVIYYGYKFVPE
jgi:uncharacterized OB-fold protein